MTKTASPSKPVAMSLERVPLPARKCPRCQWVAAGCEGGTRWTSYRLIDEAPACGCGNCGFIVLLSEPGVHATFYVDGDGKPVNCSPKIEEGKRRH